MYQGEPPLPASTLLEEKPFPGHPHFFSVVLIYVKDGTPSAALVRAKARGGQGSALASARGAVDDADFGPREGDDAR
jgi:hypothetical protein